MRHLIIPSILAFGLAACGQSGSGSKPGFPHLPRTPNEGLDFNEDGKIKTERQIDLNKFELFGTNFTGQYISIHKGQVFNLDAAMELSEPLQMLYRKKEDPEEKILVTLDKRPQHLATIDEEFVLLTRPYFEDYNETTYEYTEYAEDSFLINIKTGRTWLIDEFFPVPGSFQTVSDGFSKKLVFLGRSNGKSHYCTNEDQLAAYNWHENFCSPSLDRENEVVVSIDYTDLQQITLTPLTSAIKGESIEWFKSDSVGNLIFRTYQYSSQTSSYRTYAIIQNGQSPILNLVSGIIDDNWASRLHRDEKGRIWEIRRGAEYGEVELNSLSIVLRQGRAVVERQNLATVDIRQWSYLRGEVFMESFGSTHTFSVGNVVIIYDQFDGSANGFYIDNDYILATLINPNYQQLMIWSGGNDSHGPKVNLVDLTNRETLELDSSQVFGEIRADSLILAENNSITFNTIEAERLRSYRFDSDSLVFHLEKTTRLQVDNRVRILIEVQPVN